MSSYASVLFDFNRQLSASVVIMHVSISADSRDRRYFTPYFTTL